MYIADLTCGPIAQWSEYSHDLRGILGSESQSGPVLFHPLRYLLAQYRSVLGLRETKELSRRFRRFDEIVTGLPYDSIAQWSEYSQGDIGFSSGRVMLSFLPSDM